MVHPASAFRLHRGPGALMRALKRIAAHHQQYSAAGVLRSRSMPSSAA
jgi:hypothetical protein